MPVILAGLGVLSALMARNGAQKSKDNTSTDGTTSPPPTPTEETTKCTSDLTLQDAPLQQESSSLDVEATSPAPSSAPATASLEGFVQELESQLREKSSAVEALEKARAQLEQRVQELLASITAAADGGKESTQRLRTQVAKHIEDKSALEKENAALREANAKLTESVRAEKDKARDILRQTKANFAKSSAADGERIADLEKQLHRETAEKNHLRIEVDKYKMLLKAEQKKVVEITSSRPPSPPHGGADENEHHGFLEHPTSPISGANGACKVDEVDRAIAELAPKLGLSKTDIQKTGVGKYKLFGTDKMIVISKIGAKFKVRIGGGGYQDLDAYLHEAVLHFAKRSPEEARQRWSEEQLVKLGVHV